MAVYKTPGVYVEEISTFPPSVAPVATAVPGFVGYTKQAALVKEVVQPNNTPVRISSLLEFESILVDRLRKVRGNAGCSSGWQ